jgi:hypothetical protein
MKRWMVVAAVVAVVLAVAVPALAKGRHKARGKAKFNLVAKIVAVDGDASTLTVHVKSGTKTVKAYRHKDLVLTVDPGARIRLVTPDGVVKAALADLAVGEKVKVRGVIDRSDPQAIVCHARFVKAKALPSPEPSTPAPDESETP